MMIKMSGKGFHSSAMFFKKERGKKPIENEMMNYTKCYINYSTVFWANEDEHATWKAAPSVYQFSPMTYENSNN